MVEVIYITLTPQIKGNHKAIFGCIQSLDWTSGLDWWTGLLDSVSFFFFFFSFWRIFGQLVVAIATLNVKYAGEPVYLALSVILGLCAILSLGIISIVRLPFVLS